MKDDLSIGWSKDIWFIPKRKLGETEKQIIALRLEKMKLEREKSILILTSGVILFLAFVVLSIVGVLNGLINKNQLNMLIIGGLIALVTGLAPYIRFVIREGESLEKMLKELVS